MKLDIHVECTPEEARAFMGLPDVRPLNEHMVHEMKARMEANMAALAPEELLRTWMMFGDQATEHFRKLMGAAAAGSAVSPSSKAR